MKKALAGRKTYAAIGATVAVAIAKPALTDALGPELAEAFGAELHTALVLAFGSLAVWARAKAQPKAKVVIVHGGEARPK